MAFANLLAVLCFTLLLSLGAPFSTAQGADTSGEVTITWDAHGGFTDTSLQIWYVGSLLVDESRSNDFAGWETRLTQALTLTYSGLEAGNRYVFQRWVLGCTASQVSGVVDGAATQLEPSCSERVFGGQSSVLAVAAATDDSDDSDDSDSEGDAACTQAYSGDGGTGSISFSWTAKTLADDDTGVAWYCVTTLYEAKATSQTSATFVGLSPGEEYSWTVESFSCGTSESLTEGTCTMLSTEESHAAGSAIASGRRARSTGSRTPDQGRVGSSGSSSNSSSSGGGSSESSAISKPPVVYLDHNVTVSGAANFQAVTGGGIGNPAVIEQGVVSATDVWGNVPSGTRVCFIDRSGGGVMFLDAATSPRALSWLSHSVVGSDTCVSLPGAGTVVLISGGAAVINAVTPTAAEEPPPRSPICQIKLEETLFLRDSPQGSITDLVWLNTEVWVYAVEGRWYLVEFEGQYGYISSHYSRVLSGAC
ncbi:MAG: hypothetical protein OXE95_11490 [Chloroflexi bacterium]|nr:hypothetical protein [Chloroflexota bacterium]